MQTGRPLREPKAPEIPTSLTPATAADTELVHDGKYLSLAYGPVTITAEDVEDPDFERCRFEQTYLPAIVLHRAGFADVEFTGCDMANARLFNSRMFNAAVTTCRMTGLQLTEAGLRDVTFEGCRADLANFRFAHLRDVVFRDCNLSEAGFQNAELTHVRFERCKLTATQFSNARMNNVHFSACDLNGVRGITSFAGATVSNNDAMGLLDAMASALGITIEN
ncbi:pentapeptide repeat-containing protein [Actinomadura flavalba]|uniref:pentapeptide repeat-containing protein n=1 Tax=Actinomadura flavalba TaxID=1120938 RepID=UPI000362E566|nr:pentapeptide repeat-containing protein [Actinomadura flavalba]